MYVYMNTQRETLFCKLLVDLFANGKIFLLTVSWVMMVVVISDFICADSLSVTSQVDFPEL